MNEELDITALAQEYFGHMTAKHGEALVMELIRVECRRRAQRVN